MISKGERTVADGKGGATASMSAGDSHTASGASPPATPTTAGYTPCLWPWMTLDATNVDPGAVLKHFCESPDGHPMEHRCLCGELCPS